jgi:hypothetical protein
VATLVANQLLVGNAAGALIQTTNLSWNNSTNTLSATNFVGSGSGLTSLTATNITGTLPIANGGTGVATLVANQLLVGNAAGALIQTTNLSWNNSTNTLSATNFVGSGSGLTSLNATNITGTLPIANGGTGVATLVAGQLLVGNAAGALIQTTNLSWNNSTNTLSATNFIGSGAGLTSLNATNITGTLPIANGGTGVATLVAGQLLVGNAAGALIQTTNLSWNNSTNTLSATNFVGSGAGLTSLTATNITGTLPASQGGTGCTSLSTTFFDTTGGILSLKSGSIGGSGSSVSSQWTTLNNNIHFNTGNVGIGITNPNYKLHVDDGILFVGDSLYLNNSSLNTANNYYLLFDNTFNAILGSGIAANKIRLMNDTSNNILAGFGMENNSIAYHSGTFGSHTFYSGTTNSNYGTGRFQIDQLGNITCTGDFAAFTSISDKRLKTNIIKLDSSIDIIKNLNPVKFNWKYNDFIIDNKQGKEDVGFIAQEIEEIIPLATGEYKVINSEETYKNIKYERIIPYLVKSIQELIDKVDKLEQEIVLLKSKN